MRGPYTQQDGIFRLSPARGVSSDGAPPAAHTKMCDIWNMALIGLSTRLTHLDAQSGWTSIVPEELLHTLLLQALHSIRSGR